MKTVLVTGGKGFIGSHLIELLLNEGYFIVNIDKETYASNINFHPNNKNYTFIKEDILQLKELPECDYICHLAAESHVDKSIESSDPFIDSNVRGTYNILELIKNKKIEHMQKGWEHKYPKFIYVGTDEVLGDIEKGFFKENAELIPSNPYSASKACAEMLVRAWGRTFDIPYCITRTTNNYGERQHPEKLIPHTITQLLNGDKVKIHNKGEAIRNWIYVKDNCDAILKVMERGKDKELYHISSSEEYSVHQIVEMICDKLGKNFNDSVCYIPERKGQDIRYALDNTKVKNELGWSQKENLSTTLDRIILSYEAAKD